MHSRRIVIDEEKWKKVGNINSTNEIMTRLGSIFADVDVSHSLTIQYSRKIVPFGLRSSYQFRGNWQNIKREKSFSIFYSCLAFEYAEIFS